MNSKVSNELIIIILLFFSILFTIYILFYDCLPFSEDRVKSIEYQANDNVKSIMEEIKSKSPITDENNVKVIKTFTVDKTELTAHNGEEYEAGKKNPFSENSEPIEETVTREITEGETTKANSSNPSKGTFFESEDSK